MISGGENFSKSSLKTAEEYNLEKKLNTELVLLQVVNFQKYLHTLGRYVLPATEQNQNIGLLKVIHHNCKSFFYICNK